MLGRVTVFGFFGRWLFRRRTAAAEFAGKVIFHDVEIGSSAEDDYSQDGEKAEQSAPQDGLIPHDGRFVFFGATRRVSVFFTTFSVIFALVDVGGFEPSFLVVY